jgi:hypothetical protein
MSKFNLIISIMEALEVIYPIQVGKLLLGFQEMLPMLESVICGVTTRALIISTSMVRVFTHM